jgi:hypothetical protein
MPSTRAATSREPAANPPGQSPVKTGLRSNTTDGIGSTIAGHLSDVEPARNW